MTNKTFLEHLDEMLGIYSTGVRLMRTAAEGAHNSRKYGFNADALEENYRDVYQLSTTNHPAFNPFRGWYKEGGKRFPDDLTLNLNILKYWYICDGGVDWGDNRSNIAIYSANESDRKQFIKELFHDIGYSPWYTRNRIKFNVSESRKLLEQMGKPLRGFKYKWAIDDKKRYKNLKTEAYQ